MWNKIQTHSNPSWMAQLQNQLTEALPAYFDCTESQAADLRITQQWLRTMLWQLCVSQGLVSSMGTDNTLTFKYPIEISRDLLSMTHQFSQHSMEVLGVGLVSVAPSSHPHAPCKSGFSAIFLLVDSKPTIVCSMRVFHRSSRFACAVSVVEAQTLDLHKSLHSIARASRADWTTDREIIRYSLLPD